jgi:hypothetical protein
MGACHRQGGKMLDPLRQRPFLLESPERLPALPTTCKSPGQPPSWDLTAYIFFPQA